MYLKMYWAVLSSESITEPGGTGRDYFFPLAAAARLFGVYCLTVLLLTSWESDLAATPASLCDAGETIVILSGA